MKKKEKENTRMRNHVVLRNAGSYLAETAFVKYYLSDTLS